MDTDGTLISMDCALSKLQATAVVSAPHQEQPWLMSNESFGIRLALVIAETTGMDTRGKPLLQYCDGINGIAIDCGLPSVLGGPCGLAKPRHDPCLLHLLLIIQHRTS